MTFTHHSVLLHRVAINIDWVLEAIEFLIECNILYQELKETDWRNEHAIADYRRDATFTIRQHTIFFHSTQKCALIFNHAF